MELVVRQSDGITRSLPLLESQTVKLGASSQADVVCRGEDLQGIHCGILWKRGQFEVRISKGASPVTLNGALVTKAALRDGDVLLVGDVRVEVRSTPDDLSLQPLDDRGGAGRTLTQSISADRPPDLAAAARTDDDLGLAPLEEDAAPSPPAAKRRRAKAWSNSVEDEPDKKKPATGKPASGGQGVPLADLFDDPGDRSGGGAASLVDRDLDPVGDLGLDLPDPLAPGDGFAAGPLAMPAKGVVRSRLPGIDVRSVARSRWFWLACVCLACMAAFFGVRAWIADMPTAADVFLRAEEALAAERFAEAADGFDDYLFRAPSSRRAPRAKVLRAIARMQSTIAAQSDGAAALGVARELLHDQNASAELAAHDPQFRKLLEHAAAAAVAKARAAGADDQALANARDAILLVELRGTLAGESQQAASRATRVWRRQLALARAAAEVEAGLTAALADLASPAAESSAALSQWAPIAELTAAHPQLRSHAAVRQAAESLERTLAAAVRFETLSRPAETAAPASRVRGDMAFGVRVGPAPAANVAQSIALLDEDAGAVYAFDAACGRLLWRRFVGWDLPWQPQPTLDGSDYTLLVDSQSMELLRVESTSGRLAWRAALDPLSLPPVIANNSLYVANAAGNLAVLDAATGATRGAFWLPQGPSAPPAIDAARQLAYLPAEHGFLYVLQLAEGECPRVAFTGHSFGAATLSPALLGDLLVLPLDAGPAGAELHVFRRDATGASLAPVQTLVLPHRIERPLLVGGDRMLASTADGWLLIKADASNATSPLTIERQDSGHAIPLLSLDARGRFLVAGAGLTEIDPAAPTGPRPIVPGERRLSQPARAVGDSLIIAERLSSGGLHAIALTPDGAGERWHTQVGGAAWLATSKPPASKLFALHASGAVFDLTADALSNGSRVRDQPASMLSLPRRLTEQAAAIRFSDGTTVVSPGVGDDFLVVVDAATGAGLTSRLPAKLSCHPVAWGERLIVPLASGQIGVFDPRTLAPLAEPFQPRLKLGSLPQWRPPRPIDAERFSIEDGLGNSYTLTLTGDAELALVAMGEPRPAESPGEALHSAGREPATLSPAGDLAAAFENGEQVVDVTPTASGDTIVTSAAGAAYLLSGEASPSAPASPASPRTKQE